MIVLSSLLNFTRGGHAFLGCSERVAALSEQVQVSAARVRLWVHAFLGCSGRTSVLGGCRWARGCARVCVQWLCSMHSHTYTTVIYTHVCRPASWPARPRTQPSSPAAWSCTPTLSTVRSRVYVCRYTRVCVCVYIQLYVCRYTRVCVDSSVICTHTRRPARASSGPGGHTTRVPHPGSRPARAAGRTGSGGGGRRRQGRRG